VIKTNLLKAKQTENGLKAAEVSAAVGITPQQYSKILHNRIRCDINRAVAIANALGLSQEEFWDIFLSDGFVKRNIPDTTRSA